MEKTDRRVRKTRSLLLQGLVKLMETQDIQNISVKELTELADINRGTFYLHYNDIYDMLDKIEDEMFLEFYEIVEHQPLDARPQSIYETLLGFFQFLDRHRDLAKVMLGPHGDLSFVNRLKNVIQERLLHFLSDAKADANYEYTCSFIISGCVGVIQAWLKEPSPQSSEEMAQIVGNMLAKQLISIEESNV